MDRQAAGLLDLGDLSMQGKHAVGAVVEHGPDPVAVDPNGVPGLTFTVGALDAGFLAGRVVGWVVGALLRGHPVQRWLVTAVGEGGVADPLACAPDEADRCSTRFDRVGGDDPEQDDPQGDGPP